MSLDELWGAVLADLDWDLPLQRLTLMAEVNGELGTARHTLLLEGVADVRFSTSIPAPWSYSEITEIRLERTASGSRLLEIVLWSEEAKLTVTCDRASLDGVTVPDR